MWQEGHAWQGGMHGGGVHGQGACMVGDMCGEGVHGEGMQDIGQAWQGGGGGHAWLEGQPQQRAVCILLECIHVTSNDHSFGFPIIYTDIYNNILLIDTSKNV